MQSHGKPGSQVCRQPSNFCRDVQFVNSEHQMTGYVTNNSVVYHNSTVLYNHLQTHSTANVQYYVEKCHKNMNIFQ